MFNKILMEKKKVRALTRALIFRAVFTSCIMKEVKPMEFMKKHWKKIAVAALLTAITFGAWGVYKLYKNREES